MIKYGFQLSYFLDYSFDKIWPFLRVSTTLREDKHPASRAFSYGTYALYREKTLNESCPVFIEHAQRVAKIQFRTQAVSPFM